MASGEGTFLPGLGSYSLSEQDTAVSAKFLKSNQEFPASQAGNSTQAGWEYIGGLLRESWI
jgi:hypothetical protein